MPLATCLLVFPKPNRIGFDTTWTVNLGLAYMGACLERAGHEVLVHDENVHDPSTLPGKVGRSDVAAIYTVTATFRAAQRIARSIKRVRPSCVVVLGGPHPTARPVEVMDTPEVDYVCIGEGERFIVALVDALSDPGKRTTIAGLVRRESGGVVQNGKAAEPEGLDDLPFPSHRLFPASLTRPTRPSWIDASTVRPASMMSSRGCPFTCSFCASAAGRPFAKRYRAMSPERVLDEVEWLVRDFGVTFVEFQDDVFNLQPDRAERICELLIERRTPIRWSIPNGLSRVENVTESFLRLAKRSGCVDAWFAAESGSERIRDESIRKGNTVGEVRAAVEAARRVGLATGAFFVFGNPDETLEDMEATIDFACSLPIERAQFTIATPFPGTSLWDRIDREGRWLVKEYDRFGPYENVVYFELGRLRAEDVLRAYKRAFRRFYLRPGHIARNVLFRRETYTNLPLLARQAARFMR
jgi:radical SAM superfamily enzyme YgiQ (UPF0313 family)